MSQRRGDEEAEEGVDLILVTLWWQNQAVEVIGAAPTVLQAVINCWRETVPLRASHLPQLSILVSSQGEVHHLCLRPVSPPSNPSEN